MKSLKEFLNESEAPVNVTGDAVATRPTVMGAPVYHIPHNTYVKLTGGKQRGQKWKEIIDDVDLASELKNRIYAGKPTVLCCAEYPSNHIFLKMKP